MPDDNTENTNEKKSSKAGLIILIVVILVTFIGGYFTAKMMTPVVEKETPSMEKVIPDSIDGMPNHEKITIAGIAVNPYVNKSKVSSRKRKPILALKITFKVKPKLEGNQEFTEYDAEIRDVINYYFSSKTVSFLASSRGKNIIKKELIFRINKILKESKVTDIFFPQFIIQD